MGFGAWGLRALRLRVRSLGLAGLGFSLSGMRVLHVHGDSSLSILKGVYGHHVKAVLRVICSFPKKSRIRLDSLRASGLGDPQPKTQSAGRESPPRTP